MRSAIVAVLGLALSAAPALAQDEAEELVAPLPSSTGYGYVAPEDQTRCGDGGVCSPGAVCDLDRCLLADGTAVAPDRADPEYDHRSRIHGKLVVAGAIILPAAWLLNGIIGLFAGYHLSLFGSTDHWEPGWGEFRGLAWVPLLGPWIQQGFHHETGGWFAFLSVTGGVQLVGLGLMILGAALEGENRPDHPAFAVAPLVGDGTVGLSVGGTLF